MSHLFVCPMLIKPSAPERLMETRIEHVLVATHNCSGCDKFCGLCEEGDRLLLICSFTGTEKHINSVDFH